MIAPLYGGVIALANVVASLVDRVAPTSHGKLARTLRARHNLLDRWHQQCIASRDPNKPLVWFHAPSVGEGLQARPVIDGLRAARPEVQIAYTYFSPSAEKFAQTLQVDMSGYLPFDSVKAAQVMIEMLAPSALFFSKLDVWPNLVRVAHARGVKTGLLSATLAPGSGRQGTWARMVLHDAYSALDVIGAIDASNADRLAELGVRRDHLSVVGDTRFDQVWQRAKQVDRNSTLLQSLQSTRPTLVAGSTWPADESVLLPAWTDVRKRVSSARLIIAPHEPTAEHIEPLEVWAAQHGLTASRLSHLATIEPSASIATRGHTAARCDVVIVDRVGVLGDIYGMANVAFVGGGFHKAGLHSVIEPAAFGVPVVFGPSYHMSREAGLLLAHSAATSVRSREDCVSALMLYLANDAERVRAGAAAAAFVQTELGAAARSLALVLGALDR